MVRRPMYTIQCMTVLIQLIVYSPIQ